MGEHKRPPKGDEPHVASCSSDRACPVPDAHRRLDAAHRLWHQAEASYAEPDGFTANLNACIQALRSVTWVLQKGKRSIPDFDS